MSRKSKTTVEEAAPEEPVEPTELPDISRVGDLEVDIDPEFGRKEWRAERAGWGVLSLLAIAALLGLFGTGPLSGATAGTEPDGIRVRYARFARKLSPTMLEVQLGAKAGQDGKARVWFSRDYIERFEILRTTPEPSSVEAREDRLIFVFDVADPAQATAVTLHMRPERAGIVSARVGLSGGASFPIRQYIYP